MGIVRNREDKLERETNYNRDSKETYQREVLAQRRGRNRGRTSGEGNSSAIITVDAASSAH